MNTKLPTNASTKTTRNFTLSCTPKFLQTTLLSALFFLLLGVGESWGQASVLYTSLSSTTPAPSNSRFALNTMSLVFKQYRFQANQNVSSGGSSWAFHQGSTGTPDYTKCWRPYTGSNTLSANT